MRHISHALVWYTHMFTAIPSKTLSIYVRYAQDMGQQFGWICSRAHGMGKALWEFCLLGNVYAMFGVRASGSRTVIGQYVNEDVLLSLFGF